MRRRVRVLPHAIFLLGFTHVSRLLQVPKAFFLCGCTYIIARDPARTCQGCLALPSPAPGYSSVASSTAPRSNIKHFGMHCWLWRLKQGPTRDATCHNTRRSSLIARSLVWLSEFCGAPFIHLLGFVAWPGQPYSRSYIALNPPPSWDLGAIRAALGWWHLLTKEATAVPATTRPCILSVSPLPPSPPPLIRCLLLLLLLLLLPGTLPPSTFSLPHPPLPLCLCRHSANPPARLAALFFQLQLVLVMPPPSLLQIQGAAASSFRRGR